MSVEASLIGLGIVLTAIVVIQGSWIIVEYLARFQVWYNPV